MAIALWLHYFVFFRFLKVSSLCIALVSSLSFFV
jgi:hypothetical protein